jgi:hypothetical protein
MPPLAATAAGRCTADLAASVQPHWCCFGIFVPLTECMSAATPRQRLMAHFLTYCAIKIRDGTRDTTTEINGTFDALVRHYLLNHQ